MPNLDRFVPRILCVLLVSIASAQAPVESVAAKFVVHDIGGWWHNVMVRRDDGTVAAVGNPWLGRIRPNSLPLTGINDITRLDALGAGRTEVVAAVGSAGLTTVRWNDIVHAYDLATWAQPQLAGARAVRAASFVTQHVVTVLCADGATLRSFRYQGVGSGFEVASFTTSAPVLDYEPFRTANGVGKLLVATAAGLVCCAMNGASEWTLAGTSGDLLPWRGDPSVRAAWLHRGAGGEWRVALLGDDGPVRIDSLGALPTAESVIAGFAIDADGDETTDLVVESGTATRVFLQTEGGSLEFAETVANSGTGVADVIATHGGAHAWLVHGPSANAVQWTRLGQSSALLPAADMELFGTTFLDQGETSATKVDFNVEIAAEWLQPFVRSDRQTWLQVVAWRQRYPADDGRLDEVSESNVMFPLVAPPIPVTSATRWPLSVTMAPEFNPLPTPPGWDSDDHYWLTIRVVRSANADSLAPDRVSDPVTFATSLSIPQRLSQPPWQYLLSLCGPGATAAQLPTVIKPPGGGSGPSLLLGGIVVGVITRINLPPPPPPSGVPSPRAATPGPSSNQLNP